MKSGVYYITNKVTNETYIGSSKDINRRWKVHKSKKVNTKISLSIQQYGWDNHVAGVITYCDINEAKKLEKEYLDYLQPKLNTNKIGFDKKEYMKKYNKDYFQTEKGKDKQKEYQKGYRAKKKTQQGDI